MKLRLLLIFVITLCIKNAHSQKTYIHFNGGYAFSIASQTRGSDLASSSETVVKGTFGKGINFGGCLGYNLKEHFSAEIGINYIAGSKYTLSNTSYRYYPETVDIKGKMLKLIPAIKISIGESAKMYMKLGLAMGIRNRIIVDDQYQDGYNNYSTTEVYSGRIAYGLNAALGIEKMTTTNFGFFAELNSTSLSWSPKSSEYTKFEVNGRDQLSTMTTYESSFNYVSSYNPNSTQKPTEPRTVLRSYYAFSNIGINLGIKIAF